MTFFDSNTGKPLFNAPKGRNWKEWVKESSMHGWPSFRDDEVNWDLVRVLPDGETVSVDGTHLGHNIPDKYVCLAFLLFELIVNLIILNHSLLLQSSEKATDTASI